MSYSIELETKLTIKVDNCNFRLLTLAFLKSLGDLFSQFVSTVLLYYFEYYYENNRLPSMLGVEAVARKTTNERTKFKTLLGVIEVPQIELRVRNKNGKWVQMSITRRLLGISSNYQIPDFMKDLMGWIGSVSTFRVGLNTIEALTNFKCSLTTLWQSAKYYAKKIKLSLHADGINEYEADGTGIPTTNSGKRGSELKKVFQRTKEGKLHLVGISIGAYKSVEDWRTAFGNAIKQGAKIFKTIILASDGDTSIIDTAKELFAGIKIQKDKWHVFHQLKYYLWQDGLKKEGKNSIIAHFFKISMLFKRSVKERSKRIERYIFLLDAMGYKHTATYLKTAMEGFYTNETEGNKNIYTSKTERSMRTTNQRINVGLWSESGALAVAKIRLAYYYNGMSPLNWKK